MKNSLDSTPAIGQPSNNRRSHVALVGADPSPTRGSSFDAGSGGEDDLDEVLVPASRRSRSWAKWTLALVATVGMAFGYQHYRSASATPVQSLKTTTIARGDIVQAVTANGQIKAVKTVTVGSQVSGLITEILADYNSRVTNGQVVARLDSSSSRQLLIQTEADLANATASRSLASVNFRRSKELLASKLISQADYDQAEATLLQAEATVKTREASFNKAKVDLEHTTISSPIDGVVISRAVDVGQTVAASFNAPTLFTIANDLREMRIEAAVSEADVGGVLEGQTVNFTTDAFPGRTFTGRVSQVRYEPVVSQNVVNYVAIVDVRNDDLKLRPGMTANASIITSERRDVLRLPSAALRFRPVGVSAVADGATTMASTSAPSGSSAARSPDAGAKNASVRAPSGTGAAGSDASDKTIYVVPPDAASGAAKPVRVRTGISDGSWTEVLSGLAEGDVIATGMITAAAKATTTAGSGSSPFAQSGPPR